MGGELGGPGGKAPRFRPQRTRGVLPSLGHGVQGGSWGRSPPVYKCTAYKGGPGACPRFHGLG